MRGLLQCGSVGQVIVLAPPQQVAVCSAMLQPLAETRVKVVTGSAGRADWVRSALAVGAVQPSDVVLVHDPARPFTPAATVGAVIDAVRAGASAAVPVEPVTDTIKVVDSAGVVCGTRDRSLLRSAQSPHGFRAEVLLRADPADPLGALGGEVRTVTGHPRGRRLASPFDVAVMEALLTVEGTS